MKELKRNISFQGFVITTVSKWLLCRPKKMSPKCSISSETKMSVLAAVGHNNLAIITTSSNGSLGFNSDSWRCRSSTSTFQLTCQVSQSSISILASFYLQYTVLENPSKSLILLGNFENILTTILFLINICPSKNDLSGNTVWTKVPGFQNSPKSMIFGIFNELCPLKNVNAARFARNDE